jgi:hypothetical protein
MGWMHGFMVRAGEDAHEQNMLDIQNKVNRHKSVIEHLQKLAEDPAYMPEAQQAFQQKAISLQQLGPMKAKDKDLDFSSLLTVHNPSLTSMPTVDAPTSDGGPAGKPDPTRPFFYSPDYSSGYQTPIDRSAKWSPFEQQAIAAKGTGMKAAESYKYQLGLKQAGAKPGKHVMTHEDIAQYTNGEQTPPPGVYDVMINADGTISNYIPTKETYRNAPAGYVDGKPTYMRSNTAFGDVTPAPTQPDTLPPVPGGSARLWGTGPSGEPLNIAVNSYNQPMGQIVANPPVAQVGRVTTRDQMVDTGGELQRMQLQTTSKPAVSTQFNYAPNAAVTSPASSSPFMSSQQQQPGQTPGAQPLQGQPSPQGVPADVAPAVEPPTLNPRIITRNGAESLKTAVTDLRGTNTKEDYISPKFSPKREIDHSASEGPGGYDPRANIIKKTTRPATIEQLHKWKESDNIYTRVRELMRGVYDNRSVLNNLIDSGRVSLASSSDPEKLLIVRVLGRLIRSDSQGNPQPADIKFMAANGLTPQEAKLVADFVGMREHIQKMRGPLGAAGFRSVEAFMSLQDQKGNLMASPAVTQYVIENSMKTFLSIQAAGRWSMNGGKPVDPDIQTLKDYMMAYGNDPVRAEAEMKADGFR